MIDLVHLGKHILDSLNSVPKPAYDMAVDTIMGAFVVSPLALAIKKWRDINSEKIMMALVIFGSLLTSAWFYLQEVPEAAPWIIFVQGLLTLGASQPVYFFFIKPLSRRLAAWIAIPFDNLKAKIQAVAPQVDGDLVTAATPLDASKVTTTPPSPAAVEAAKPERQDEWF